MNFYRLYPSFFGNLQVPSRLLYRYFRRTIDETAECIQDVLVAPWKEMIRSASNNVQCNML